MTNLLEIANEFMELAGLLHKSAFPKYNFHRGQVIYTMSPTTDIIFNDHGKIIKHVYEISAEGISIRRQEFLIGTLANPDIVEELKATVWF